MDLPLRDIHLSDPISWWPLAYGWWLLIGFAIGLVLMMAIIIRRILKPTLKKEALYALDMIEQVFKASNDSLACVAALSELLRRVSLKIHPAEYAGITGSAWLQILDNHLKEPEFSQGAGKILLHAPYQQQADPKDTDALLQLCRKWVSGL